MPQEILEIVSMERVRLEVVEYDESAMHDVLDEALPFWGGKRLAEIILSDACQDIHSNARGEQSRAHPGKGS